MRRKELFARLLAWLLVAALLVLVVSACAPTRPPEDAEAQQPVAEADAQNGPGDSVANAPTSADPVLQSPTSPQTDTSTIGQASEPENAVVQTDSVVAADEREATSESEAAPESGTTSESGATSEAEAASESEAAPENEAMPPVSEDPAHEASEDNPAPAALESEPIDAAGESILPTDAGQEESAAPPSEEPSREADQATADAAPQESGHTGAMEESPPQDATAVDASVDPTDSESAGAADTPQDAYQQESAYWNPVPAPGESESAEELRPAVTLEELEGVYAANSCGMNLSLTIYAAIDGRAPGHITSAETGIQGCLATLEGDVLVLRLIDHSEMRLEIVSPTALRDPETFTVLHRQ